ncbi:Protein IQ-DOMAIN [Arachis hypogaea]|nr:Protein IQ-DOMAIN [Arachis hypogaea]
MLEHNVGGFRFDQREVVHSCKIDPCVQRVLSARRALRVLRAVALVRVQARVRARNVRNSPEGKAVQTLLDQYRNQADPIKEAEEYEGGCCSIFAEVDGAPVSLN